MRFFWSFTPSMALARLSIKLPLALAAAAALWLMPQAARADYRLCNRTGYVLDAALAIETKGATATQGWFRVLPGMCTTVLSGSWTGDRYFLHTRTPDFYGERPEANAISRMFCVRAGDFLIGGAEQCANGSGALAAFSEVVPDRAASSTTTELTDETGLGLEEARRAAIQRLLTIAGYDPGRIDGTFGAQSEAALKSFLADGHLNQSVLESAEIFDVLITAAARATRATGLTLCNGSPYRLLAAVGLARGASTVTQGWYDLDAGVCEQVRRDALSSDHVFTFAEAVDAEGRPVSSGGQPLVWAGAELLCTKNFRFEISEHGDCAARGLDTTGFRRVDTNGVPGWTVRFGPPEKG